MKVPFVHLRRPAGFTLIELLVVISIIAVLATMGVVVGNIVIDRAHRLEASTAMKSVELAIKNYKTEYLRLPSADDTPMTEDNDPFDTADQSGQNLLNVLLAIDPARNPKQIPFWVPPPAKVGRGYTTANGLRDPWGQNGYKIILDYSGDGKIDNPYSGEGEPDEITSDVIIYCAATNKTFDDGGATGGKKTDDLMSWR